ncbi:CehA/McbA family metallohydrolase [Aquisphaera insulae]|uniref:CehA/McbA family metallohydrolase n=1 Tax=Aquisphaera insulae TaxID=2712864 RepID=UPI0013EA8D6B|nr:CehA/McbA family metallohydrolase [Aquisphaera insulae]
MDCPAWTPLPAFLLSLALVLAAPPPASAERLPLVPGVEFQPLSAQARRVADALEMLGRPLPPKDRERLFRAIEGSDPEASVRAIQQVLDAHCLIGIEINAESRVKSTQGPAPARLVQNGWSAFLVKVQNGAGVTAELAASSPNAAPVFRPSTGSAEPKPSVAPGAILQRWMDVAMFQSRPLKPELSGLLLEYRIIEVYSRDAGRREARISFNVGQGSQDLGFRSDVDILFTIDPAVPVTLEVRDVDGRPAMASFLIRDGQGRVHPSAGRRLAPDFYFHPQIYRKDGETITLPPGRYEVEYTRGPEYRTLKKSITVKPGSGQSESFRLERWIHVAEQGWFSGDHHIHAAGCGHYESPSEGVKPEDMWRHIIGEDLDVGCVLAWGPCWYYQKQFFEGKTNTLSTAENVMRYDIEVSGFPSSHAGHLCLLRLKEDDYPGTTRIEQWPSWDLPVLKWGKSQGGVVGFSHSGWGLRISTDEIPSLELPPFDGIGANEYVVDVVHDAVDFISTVDTPAPWELNVWYHTLNCGYRARISGETDFPCIYGERVGLGRVYVKLADGKLDFDRWCQGLKDGRSYVGDGRSHLIDFRVDDRAVGEDGSELKLVAPGNVKVRAKVAAYLDPTPTAEAKAIRKRPLSEKPYWDLERARIGDSRTVPVEVIVNGKAVARKEVPADGEIRDVAFDVPLKASSWIALRILPSSHTNPVFVLVGNKPIRASKASADWCLKAVDRCWAQKETAIRPADRDEAKRAYDAARVSYAKIRDEAVGD